MTRHATCLLVVLLALAPAPCAQAGGDAVTRCRDAYAAVRTYHATWVRERPQRRDVTEVAFDRATLRVLVRESWWTRDGDDWVPNPGGIVRVNDGTRSRRATRSSMSNQAWQILEDEIALTTIEELAAKIPATSVPDLALLLGADPVEVCSRKGGRLAALPDTVDGPGFRVVDGLPRTETIVRLDDKTGLVRSFQVGPGERRCVEMTIDGPLDDALFDFDAQRALVDASFADDRARRRTAELPDLLRDFLEGRLPASELEITFDDLSPFHGMGARITVKGDGDVEHEILDRIGARLPRPAPDVETLVRLLLDLEGWEQRARQDDPIACGSYARLRIRAGAASSSVWENANDLDEHDRLGRVRTMMLRFAIAADDRSDHSRVTTGRPD